MEKNKKNLYEVVKSYEEEIARLRSNMKKEMNSNENLEGQQKIQDLERKFNLLSGTLGKELEEDLLRLAAENNSFSNREYSTKAVRLVAQEKKSLLEILKHYESEKQELTEKSEKLQKELNNYRKHRLPESDLDEKLKRKEEQKQVLEKKIGEELFQQIIGEDVEHQGKQRLMILQLAAEQEVPLAKVIADYEDDIRRLTRENETLRQALATESPDMSSVIDTINGYEQELAQMRSKNKNLEKLGEWVGIDLKEKIIQFENYQPVKQKSELPSNLATVMRDEAKTLAEVVSESELMQSREENDFLKENEKDCEFLTNKPGRDSANITSRNQQASSSSDESCNLKGQALAKMEEEQKTVAEILNGYEEEIIHLNLLADDFKTVRTKAGKDLINDLLKLNATENVEVTPCVNAISILQHKVDSTLEDVIREYESKIQSLEEGKTQSEKWLLEEKEKTQKLEKDVQNLLQDIVDLKMRQLKTEDDFSDEKGPEEHSLLEQNKRLKEELEQEKQTSKALSESKEEILSDLKTVIAENKKLKEDRGNESDLLQQNKRLKHEIEQEKKASKTLLESENNTEIVEGVGENDTLKEEKERGKDILQETKRLQNEPEHEKQTSKTSSESNYEVSDKLTAVFDENKELNEYKENENELQQENKRLQNELEPEKQTSEAFSKSKDEISNKLETVLDENKEFKEGRENEKKEDFLQENIRLQNELKHEREISQALSKSIYEISDKLESVLVENRKLKEDRENTNMNENDLLQQNRCLQSELEQEKQTSKALSKSNDEISSELKIVLDENKKLKEVKESIENENEDDLLQQYKRLEDELQHEKQSSKALSKSKDEMSKKLETVLSENKELKQGRKNENDLLQAIKRLQDELEQEKRISKVLSESKDEVTNELGTILVENSSLKEGAEKIIKEKEKKLSDQEENIEFLKADKKQLEDELRNFKKELVEKDEKLKEMNKNLMNAKSREIENSAEIENLKKERENYEVRLSGQDTINKDLEKNLSYCQQQLSQLNDLYEQSKAETAKLKKIADDARLSEKQKNETLKCQLDENEEMLRKTIKSYQDKFAKLEQKKEQNENQFNKEISSLSDQLELEKQTSERQKKNFDEALNREREQCKENLQLEFSREKERLKSKFENSIRDYKEREEGLQNALKELKVNHEEENKKISAAFLKEKSFLQNSFTEKLTAKDEERRKALDKLKIELEINFEKEKLEHLKTFEREKEDAIINITKEVSAQKSEMEAEFQAMLTHITKEHERDIESIENDLKLNAETFKEEKQNIVSEMESEKASLIAAHDQERELLENTVQSLLKEIVKLKQQRKELRNIHRKEKNELAKLSEQEKAEMKTNFDKCKTDLIERLQEDFSCNLSNEVTKREVLIQDLREELNSAIVKIKNLEIKLTKNVAQEEISNLIPNLETDQKDDAIKLRERTEQEYEEKLQKEKRKFEETMQGLRKEIYTLQEKRMLIQDRVYNHDSTNSEQKMIEKVIANYKKELLKKIEDEMLEKVTREKRPLEESIADLQQENDDLKQQKWDLKSQLRKEKLKMEEEFEKERENIEKRFAKEKEDLKCKYESRVQNEQAKRAMAEKVNRATSPGNSLVSTVINIQQILSLNHS